MEAVKGWKQEWFYVTEPHDATWAATLEFKYGPLMRLTSWVKKGLDRASFDEVMTLQKRVKGMIEKKTSLVDVVQVMLFRRILPCQRQTLHMWEFNPTGPRTLQQFFGTTHEEI